MVGSTADQDGTAAPRHWSTAGAADPEDGYQPVPRASVRRLLISHRSTTNRENTSTSSTTLPKASTSVS
jgi:hypothetical protein